MKDAQYKSLPRGKGAKQFLSYLLVCGFFRKLDHSNTVSEHTMVGEKIVFVNKNTNERKFEVVVTYLGNLVAFLPFLHI